MWYRHVVLDMNLASKHADELLNELQEAGFRPVFFGLVRAAADQFALDIPKASAPDFSKAYPDDDDVRELYRGLDRREVRAIRYSTIGKVAFEGRRAVRGPIVADLFNSSKWPNTTFCLEIEASKKEKRRKESRVWLACWSSKNPKLEDGLQAFAHTFLKVAESEKALEALCYSRTYSMTHEQIVTKLKGYKLNRFSLADRREFYELLSDPQNKDFLRYINMRGKILESDLVEDKELKGISKIDERRKVLEKAGLIESNLVVICNERGAWWNIRIPSEAKLEEIKRTGITCAFCGKSIDAESIERLLSLTEAGRDIVASSRWMTGAIIASLEEFGVDQRFIFAGVKIGSEEIDLLCLCLNQILVFELKDRQFSLGDAYKFHAKVSRLIQRVERDVRPIVITTEKVAKEASRLLEEVSPGESLYYFIEGYKNIGSSLGNLIGRFASESVEARLERVIAAYPANLLVSGKMFVQSA